MLGAGAGEEQPSLCWCSSQILGLRFPMLFTLGKTCGWNFPRLLCPEVIFVCFAENIIPVQITIKNRCYLIHLLPGYRNVTCEWKKSHHFCPTEV